MDPLGIKKVQKENLFNSSALYQEITQGPRKSGWHGWHATRQFQPTGGCHPSYKATIASQPPIFSIFIYSAHVADESTQPLRNARMLPMHFSQTF